MNEKTIGLKKINIYTYNNYNLYTNLTHSHTHTYTHREKNCNENITPPRFRKGVIILQEYNHTSISALSYSVGSWFVAWIYLRSLYDSRFSFFFIFIFWFNESAYSICYILEYRLTLFCYRHHRRAYMNHQQSVQIGILRK